MHPSLRVLLSLLCPLSLAIPRGRAQTYYEGGTTVTISTGQSTTIPNTGYFYIGNNGNGTVQLTDNGQLIASTWGFLGNLAGSTGTINMSGTSLFTTTGPLIVGYAGTGDLNLSGNADLVTSALVIGANSTGTGTALLDGSGVTVQVTGGGSNDLQVGQATSRGTLQILNGAQLSAGQAHVNASATFASGISVDGSGSALNVTNSSNDGFARTLRILSGTLAVTAGGTVASEKGTIGSTGSTAGNPAVVTLDGSGSAWNLTSALTMAQGTDTVASLSITNGASLVTNSSSLSAAYGARVGVGGQATILVSGAGSTWTNTGSATIGFSGASTLTVANGGAFAAGALILGERKNSTAAAAGIGTLNLHTGGTVTLGGGTGTLTLAANTLTGAFGTTGTLNLGNGAAAGTLNAGTVTSLGTATVNFNHTDAAYVFAPTLAGSLLVNHLGTGTTILTGANTYTGGTTISAGTLQIGNGGITGSHTGNITNQAALIFNRSDASTYSGVITGSGSLTKTGAGTLTLTVAHSYLGHTAIQHGALTLDGGALNAGTVGDVYAGYHAGENGTVNLVNGGDISGRSSYLGIDAGSQGTATISGAGSTWTNSVEFIAAYAGTGTLTIANGGSLINVGSYIGYDPGSIGTVTVTGAGSTWTNTGDLIVARAGTGTLTIREGGAVSAPSLQIATATGVLNIGAHDLGSPTTGGTLTADTVIFGFGTGRVNFNQTDTFTLGAAVSGDGQLAQRGSGTTILTGNNTYTGGTTVSAGTLLANNSTGSATGTGAVNIATGATLGGTGFIGGLTTVSTGGHLAPGGSPAGAGSTGTLTFTSGLALNGGAILDFQLGTASDLLVISSSALSGPTSGLVTLNFSNSGGFGAGTYTLLNYTTATSTTNFGAGSFALGSTIAGYNYNLAANSGLLQLTATAIPEPSTYALLVGVCTLAMAWVRRRRSLLMKGPAPAGPRT
jgi:T5SS/PEP-CTERM-associated repeat protein/autotransporter-associated beta strand protein